MHVIAVVLGGERFTCISPEIQPVMDDEIVADLAFPLSVRWCRQTRSVFHDQTTVVEFRKKFDHIQPKQVHYHQCSTTLFVEIPLSVSPISRALVPLICFATVEFHQVDGVVRQFGW